MVRKPIAVDIVGQRPIEVADTGFHLDRRIPVALIFSLIIQTIAIVWWASQVSYTISQHDSRIVAIEVSGPAPIRERLIVVEAQLTTLKEGQHDISQTLKEAIVRSEDNGRKLDLMLDHAGKELK